MPDVDLFVRSSGEQRTSNFLLWQCAYAEMVFLDTLFPDFDRRHLWQAVEIYARRDRRFGGALRQAHGGACMNEMLDVARAALERYHDVDGRRRRHAHLRPRRRGLRGAGHRAGGGAAGAQPDLRRRLGPARDDDVPTRVAMGAGEGLFGTPRVIRGEHGWDVTFRYAFPAAGLEEKAMGTLLMLVVGGASACAPRDSPTSDGTDRRLTPANGLSRPQASSIRSSAGVATTCIPARCAWPSERRPQCQATSVATSEVTTASSP